MERPLYRKTWAEIDLSAIEHNIIQVKNKLPDKCKLFAVVKADGYGHGAIKVAQRALQAGADYLAVSLLEEALELRAEDIDAPILVFGHVHPENVEIAAKHHITLTAFQREWLNEVNQRATSTPLHIHLKLDTGMGRVGIQTDTELKQFIYELNQSNCIKLTGVYTHFATADELNTSYFSYQQNRFKQMLKFIKLLHDQKVMIHWANSATAIRMPEQTYDAIRFGISMYGLYPSQASHYSSIQLREAFSLHSELIHVKKVYKGQKISYGGTYEAEQNEWIGTIPIGYADGWNRKLQDFYVLINGEQQRIVGRICMDQLMVRLHQPYPLGSKVTLIGKQGSEAITVDDIADYIDTINYEIPGMFSSRIPRIYRQ